MDVGGGGVRAGVFGWDGSLRSLVSGPPPSDGEQFNPDWTWLAVAEAIRSLTSRRIQVRAVGVTTHLATTLTDAEGQPTTSAMLWRDNRASQDARDLEAVLGPELRRVTGREASGESAAARMRMLTRTSPARLGRTRWLLSLKDYLVLKLTGRPARQGQASFDEYARSWPDHPGPTACPGGMPGSAAHGGSFGRAWAGAPAAGGGRRKHFRRTPGNRCAPLRRDGGQPGNSGGLAGYLGARGAIACQCLADQGRAGFRRVCQPAWSRFGRVGGGRHCHR